MKRTNAAFHIDVADKQGRVQMETCSLCFARASIVPKLRERACDGHARSSSSCLIVG